MTDIRVKQAKFRAGWGFSVLLGQHQHYFERRELGLALPLCEGGEIGVLAGTLCEPWLGSVQCRRCAAILQYRANQEGRA